jgi:hypothetical protein
LKPFTNVGAIGAPEPEFQFGLRIWPPLTGPATD